ncbi:MAG TPA: tetratricopeptide repeat protein [Candidatus Polarisedimenticolia bacterium]|nr:tetratricopeptide repeat protein [Candidatus Polarisedimenticolia bacterium]
MPHLPLTACRAALLGLALGAASGCGAGGPTGGGGGEPEESLPTIVAHADSAYRDADFDEAQKAYEEALKLAPDDARLVANLGSCYLKNRQVKKAEELLRARVATRPGDASAWLVLARVYVRQGQLGPAADALRTVLKYQPDSLMARYNLGFIAYRSRLYDEAVMNLQRTIELKPEHPEAHYTLGLTFLARGEVPRAVAELERAVALDPRHVGAHFNLAAAYARAGRDKDAKQQQVIYADLSGRSKAQQEKDSQIAAAGAKAVQLIVEQKYPEALAEYQALALRYPAHAPIQSQIGMLLLRLGRRSEAVQALQKAEGLDPKLSEPHYLLANLYREVGDAAAADRELSLFATLETIPEGKSGY